MKQAQQWKLFRAKNRMTGFPKKLWFVCTALLVAALSGFAVNAQPIVTGAVFTMTNSTDPIQGNGVVMFNRMSDGSLSLQGTFPTGGIGSGPAPTSTVFGIPIPATADALGSQGSMLLSNDRRHLFTVNAGSDTVSCFLHRPQRLRLADIASSGGVFPVGLAYRKLPGGSALLYVLNAGGHGNITGFRVTPNCNMIQIPGSSRSLAGTIDDPPFPSPKPNEVLTTPADIEFTPDGRRLLVSIKGNPDGGVAVFRVNPVNGHLSTRPPTVTPFSTQTDTAGPFSFLFDDNGNLIVNHGNSFTVASYKLDASGKLIGNSGPVQVSNLGEGSANLRFGGFNCWIATNGNIAYIMNFGDIPATNGGLPDGPGVIIALEIGDDGQLRKLPTDVGGDQGVVAFLPQDDRNDPNARLVGNHGVDLTVVNGDSGDFLYALQPRVGRIGGWRINEDDTLTSLGGASEGLEEGVDPFAGTNPDINLFLERCYLQPRDSRSPECTKGSPQGLVGY